MITMLSGAGIALIFAAALVGFVDDPAVRSGAAAVNAVSTGADVAPEKRVFNSPGLYELPDGSYEAHFTTDVSRFYPSTMTIPAGSKVTFFVTSPHIVRGFAIAETPVYMEAGPGWAKPATHVFGQPSTYVLVCSEHCGLTHLDMHAVIEVK